MSGKIRLGSNGERIIVLGGLRKSTKHVVRFCAKNII